MRIRLTDKFLWDVYSLIEKIDRGYDLFARRSTKEAFCPDLFQLRREYGRRQDRRNFRQLIYYLKKHGFIKIKNLEHAKGIILTPKGVEKVLKIKFKIEKRKQRSDRKWQMIIFDIPEKRRILRDILRDFLVDLGYQKLQESVWVCPYDVAKETEGIIRRYCLDPYIKLFLIEEMAM